MTKDVRIRDDQYDWLMERGMWNKKIIVVLDEIIRIINLMETDRKKYREWMMASQGKREDETEKND